MRRLRRGAAALFCVAAVPVLVLGLVRIFYGVWLPEYRPWTDDEVTYWHQALTFSQVGFRGGYYTADELTNPSGITPFGPHGPGFAILYGLFGVVFGWHRYSVVVLNLIAIGGAVSLWVALTRLSLPRLLLAGVMLLTFWHLVFWAPTGMQESLHHAGAIVLAGCFASALGPWPRRWTMALGWAAIGLLSFIRPSWIIVLPLWAVATTRHARWQVMAATIGGALLYGAIVLFAYSSTVAPYGDGFFFLRLASLSLPAQALVENVKDNLRRIVRLDQYHAIELLLRMQYGAFLLTTSAATTWALLRRGQTPQTQGQTPHLAITAIGLAVALAAMLLLYEFSSLAEHRVLSGFLLFGAMLCLAAPGRLGPLLVAALVLSNAVSVSVVMAEFEAVWRDRFHWSGRDLSELEQAIDGKIVYQPASSRWCNTLLMTSQFPPSLIAVPAGIGLSTVRKADLLRLPPRSHYILLEDKVRALSPVPLNLDAIATLPYGTLYVNRDAGCD